MRGPRSPRRGQELDKTKKMQFMRCTRASWTNKEKKRKSHKRMENTHTHTNEGCPKDM